MSFSKLSPLDLSNQIAIALFSTDKTGQQAREIWLVDKAPARQRTALPGTRGLGKVPTSDQSQPLKSELGGNH